MKLITIIIPTFNEEQSIPALYDRLTKLAKSNKKYNFEFLFVNDGSRDNTYNLIKEYAEKDNQILCVNLSRNFGQEIAIIAGIDNANGDAAVIIDADLQDPPELIPDMIKLWEEGYDDVYARRTSREGETWFKKFSAKAFYNILQKSTNIPIQIDTGNFRLFDRRCIDAIKQIRESQRHSKGIFSWIGYKKKEITYRRNPRLAGKTKWNVLKLTGLAIDGITSFTIAPLRISSFFGAIISLIAFIFIVIIIVKKAALGDPVAGYPSLMAVILFLGGIQLLSLGIIGEYIGRIFNESKNRPLYFIEEIYHKESSKKSRR